ncbi:hypothetical protein GCM10022419_119400 [Nonomuraea rosea]|uniref:Uncharacterized protein n=1 Tax=Nonomuraea rosea TaxID=638574 RepID=A0ABP6ZQH9_9ACTN
MSHELNHSRYIGSRRGLSEHEERRIKRIEQRAKSSSRKMRERRERKLEEIEQLRLLMASERKAGRYEEVLAIWPKANRLILSLYIRSHAVKLIPYIEMEAHYQWASSCK